MTRRSEKKLASWPLAVGALVGVALAAHGLVGAEPSRAAEIPADAVAVVNGRLISRADFDRALAAVGADSRSGRSRRETERRVLDRLIEEELLVQRGVELHLMERDRRVRADLSGAVIDLLVARGEQRAEPTEAELQAHYDGNRHQFVREPLQRVEQQCVDEGSGGDQRARADQVRRRWAKGEPLDDWVSSPPIPLPRGWLPITKLGDYLGAQKARGTLEWSVGQVSEPIAVGTSICFLRVLERRSGETKPFEQVRDQVRVAYLRAAGDQQLRRFLDERREASDVAIVEALQ